MQRQYIPQPANITKLADTFRDWHALEAQAVKGKEEARKALLALDRDVFTCSDGTTLMRYTGERTGLDGDKVKAELGPRLPAFQVTTSFVGLKVNKPAAAVTPAAAERLTA